VSAAPTGGNITFNVCNGASAPKTYNWSIANGGTACPCTISGLTFATTTGAVTIPAYDCHIVTVSVVPPGGMTISDVACYTVTITDPTTGLNRACGACITLCCGPPWKWIAARTLESVEYGAQAPSTNATFTIMNTGGSPAILPYRISALSTDRTTPPLTSG
jgi:hypothetical protein